MMFGLSLPSTVRRLATANLACTFVVLLAGCNTHGTGSYPPELTYPARTDPLVLEKPAGERVYADQPGTMDQLIQTIGIEEKDGGPGGQLLRVTDAPADERDKLNSALQKIFGTPFEPTVKLEEAIATKIVAEMNDDATKTKLGITDYKKTPIEDLTLDNATLAAGSQLYRRHCLTCHGLTGDGRGPTAAWIHPHPRDYRQGVFKFVSTSADKLDDVARKPHRSDLIRTLTSGVDGTTMPSFALLPADQLEQLVSYVIHLSIRGEVEFAVLRSYAPGKPMEDNSGNTLTDLDAKLRFAFQRAVTNWVKSNLEETVAKPPAYHADLPEGNPGRYGPVSEKERLESVRAGYILFTNSTPDQNPKYFNGLGACLRCHQDFGRQANFLFDQWGTLVRPANLTLGVYRGGRRPIDLYWRIFSGIGTHMPASKIAIKDADGDPTDELDGKKYWDLISFVQALPYPEMLPSDVRAKIYPSSQPMAGEQQHASR